MLVVISAPVFLFPAPSRAGLLLVLPMILIIQAWAWEQVLPVTPFNLPLLLLAVMLANSLMATPDLANSLPKISGILFGVLTFFTVARYTEQRSGWLVGLYGYILAGVGISLIGVVSTNWFTTKVTVLNTLTGSLPKALLTLPGAENGIQPNELAGALIWVIPVIVLALLAFQHNTAWFVSPLPWSRLRRVKFVLWVGLLVAAAVAILGAWLLAQSRGSYLAISISALVIVVLLLPKKMRWPGVGVGLLLGLVGMVYVQSVGVETVLISVTDTLPVNDTTFSLTSLSSRIEIWSRAVWAIRDAPLTGLGMNSFREIVHILYPMLFISPATNLGHAHNELLQAALDLGLPGLAAFLALNIAAFTMVIRMLRSHGNERLMALGLGGGLLAHFIYGLTDAVALGAKPGFLFWWLLALIFGLYRQVTMPTILHAAIEP